MLVDGCTVFVGDAHDNERQAYLVDVIIQLYWRVLRQPVL